MVEIKRRNLVKGGLWAAPAVVATTAIPAYAASTSKPVCTPAIAPGSLTDIAWNYKEGMAEVPAGEPADQYIDMVGYVAANLPEGAVITDIRYEYWIQLHDASSGYGFYPISHASSDYAGQTTFTNGDSALRNSFTFKTPTGTTSGTASSIFTEGTAQVVESAVGETHTFKRNGGADIALPGFKIEFIGDPAIANATLRPVGGGCQQLIEYTPALKYFVRDLPYREGHQRIVLLDRTSYITYTYEGETKTMSAYSPSGTFCNATATGGLNVC